MIIHFMREQQRPVDFNKPEVDQAAVNELNVDFLREAQIRYCVPVRAGREWLGLLTLGDRLTKNPFAVEDYELLQTVADQAASSLLNLHLSQRLVQHKEMDTFRTVTTFFLHDLKNLASLLSLTMQNLPAHYDDPTFRADTLRVIQGSVLKINAMCNRLSLLTRTLELRRAEVDLSALVRTTLADLNGALQATLACHLSPVPFLSLDHDQIQKVIVNLVLNASEAAGPEGKILIATAQRDNTVELSVSDNGCGMSHEFIERSLFRPFVTTKNKGLGIGLFHSKRIVEAHQGRIEVESEEGKGSVFRVVFPVHLVNSKKAASLLE
jgi:putative PEP-CTERM system histidine kinase